MKHNVHTWLRKALVWAMAIVFAWSGSGTMALAEEIGQATAAAQEAAGEKTAETTTDAATSAKGDATEAESGNAAEQKGAGAAADETSDAGTANGTASTPQEDATQRDAAASDTTAADTTAADAPAAGTTAQAQPATRTARAGEHLTVTSADELPQTIEAGATVTLGADITLAADQQIESVAGTLDGAGHTITLANKPLANQVSGTIHQRIVIVCGVVCACACWTIGRSAVCICRAILFLVITGVIRTGSGTIYVTICFVVISTCSKQTKHGKGKSEYKPFF